jgi:carbon-monoxide dehydrogenase small subunit
VSETVAISVTINGKAYEKPAEPRLNLADYLRTVIGLTGTHVGCEHGACGACTVLVDGRSVRSCLMLAVQARGRNVTTVEGLAQSDDALSVLQQAFRERHALQCGFCTPGMLMTLAEMLQDRPQADEAEIRDTLSGNICRCTGYAAIIDAALDALAEARSGAGD